MLGWLFRRRPPPAAVELDWRPGPPGAVLVRVIALLSPGYARVVVGPGVGLLAGGSEQDWPLDWLPPGCRRANAEVWWVGDPGRRPPVVEPVVAAEPIRAPDRGDRE
jgi:hypothetical protein